MNCTSAKVKFFVLPASWDLEYDVSIQEKFKEVGGYWNHEEKLWCLDPEVETPDNCKAYELSL